MYPLGCQNKKIYPGTFKEELGIVSLVICVPVHTPRYRQIHCTNPSG